MQVVLLVRHAEADVDPKRLTGRAPGFGLSDTGRRQAESLGDRLRPVRLAAIYSSPIQRCRETAEEVAAGRKLSLRMSEDLQEVDFGSWQGRTYASLLRTKLWKTVQHVPSGAAFPQGESIRELQRRGVDAVEHIRAAHRGTVAAFSHADVIKVIAAHYLGLHLDLFQRIVIPTASVTAIGFGDGFPRVLRVGDTGDYSELVPRRRRRP